MKIDFTKEWCMRMSYIEGDSLIGAGLYSLDPATGHNNDVALETATCDDSNVVFGRFVRLLRRRQGLTVEKLASDADVDISELVEIEDDTRYKPAPRTVYQLANFFGLEQNNFMQIAGLTAPKDSRLNNEAIRFAARSDPIAQLTPEEQAALEDFVAVLNMQK